MSRADPRNDGNGDAIGQQEIGDHVELEVRNPGLALTRAVREGHCRAIPLPRSVAADAKLLLVVISNETPDFDKDPAILDLALTSFLITVLRHPFRLRLDLAVYLQCTKIRRRYITPCEDGSIDKELSSY
eukprot:scaffold391_cov412-Pavlova_lutheri.AAC.15